MSIDEYESRYVDIDSPDFYASIQNSDEFKNYRYTEENLKEMFETKIKKWNEKTKNIK